MSKIDLSACPVCSKIKIENEEAFLEDLKYSIKAHPKNELIIRQGDVCDALYMLMVGSVKTEMITDNGNVLGIEIIKAPRPLAPAFLFSDNNHFPVDVTSLEEVEIMKIPKAEILRLMTTNLDFMSSFMTHNANRTQFLTNRLQLLSIKTIKGKIAHFLLENSPGEGKPFEINRNQTELADFFGVARPSLARSISEMVQEGIIEVNKKKYTILHSKALRELLV
ncbi:transcriptional regulator, Crp/Fnr family [Paludibacter propionicigenes WB4]|uniref:Transcriptional regulator, Crp/Fnr family n=1 Tax=Paludibacter propionicigenes (strain DSM 17365 / JCM 13257 / WB4) TaxID=694427 RepID=E4T2J6_PALPW|nr:Crp/Fnr family transcriptional regulator [Paludibacter propionicigenes]ADQ78940.1 transcriptional regulator, Crp/Fnr family [Paludibacter propionicigenes WB4]